jgi:IS30 family transposase
MRDVAVVFLHLLATVARLVAGLSRTLTWEHGKEIAEHVRFSVDTNIDVSFCRSA